MHPASGGPSLNVGDRPEKPPPIIDFSDLCDLPPLPSLQKNPHKLKQAACSFKKRTGLGTCSFHPRWAALLSDDTLAWLGAFMDELENTGETAGVELVRSMLLMMIQKLDGGLRPIVLFTFFFRLWARARKDIVREWERSCQRDYDWAVVGRPVDRCRQR